MKTTPLDLRDGLCARGSLQASPSPFHSLFTCPPIHRHAGFFICFAVCVRLAVNTLFVSRFAVVVVAIVIPIVPYAM